MPETASQIEVTINGETRAVPAGLALGALIDWLGLPADRVAVEHNRQIVRRRHWDEVQVRDGDALEIVQFVGGG